MVLYKESFTENYIVYLKSKKLLDMIELKLINEFEIN